MLSLPGGDTWWGEGAGEQPGREREEEDVGKMYRAHFLHTEHFNFIGSVSQSQSSSDNTEEEVQHLVASVKYYSDGHVR